MFTPFLPNARRWAVHRARQGPGAAAGVVMRNPMQNKGLDELCGCVEIAMHAGISGDAGLAPLGTPSRAS
jgi:hypothetical protein